MTGKTFSHYEIVQKLGQGGMGEVFLALDTELNRKVALKFLPSQYAGDPEFRARFKREARAAAALSHPNIITIHEVGEHDDKPYIAMEYVEGPSLKGLIAQGDLSLDKALDIAAQICEGLAAAHKEGVLHRDIKPQNILIGKDGRVRILDFGLAKLKTESLLTESDSTLGTVAYMSPEQIHKIELDERSDIFSFGTVLYEMITGRLPFKGEHHAAIIYSILNETPEPLARYKADVPDSLQRIIDKALRKAVDTRYQGAAEVLADLRELKGETTTQISAVRKPEHTGERRRPPRLGLLIGLAATVAVVLIAAFFLNKLSRTAMSPEGRASLGAAETQAGSAASWRNSIAVLPFRDFSPNKDQEYFCDGMTDAIIGNLAGLEDLKIISMSSVMRYKDTEMSVREIGRELGVATVLEGSIQKEENRIRLSAQLINVEDEAHLWSETYDRDLESIFAIQDEISQAIVDVLRIRLLGDDRASFAKRYTENLEAYNAYAQGRFLWNKRTKESLMRSIEYFEKAIELDPEYALAYAGLADAYGVLPSNIKFPAPEAVARGKPAAQKALELDEKLAEAHASMGLILKTDGDSEGAEREYLRAIELNPGYAYAHYWYAMLLNEDLGEPEEAREHAEIAYQLDPLSVVIVTNLTCMRETAGDSDGAEALFERALEIEPNRMGTYNDYGTCLRRVGRPEKALDVYKRAISVDSTYSGGYNALAYTYSFIGDFDNAIQAADKMVEIAPAEANPYDTRGDIYAYNGRLDEAIGDYRKAFEIDPTFATSAIKLGGMYLFQRNYAQAERHFRRLASDTTDAISIVGRLGLAQVPLYQGKFRKALELLEQDIPTDMSEIMQGVELAERGERRFFVYLELNELDRALEVVQELDGLLQKLRPHDRKKLRDGYAVVWALQGKMEEAEEAVREWREDLDEQNPSEMADYWRVRGYLELIKGYPNNAITHLRKGLSEFSKPLFIIRYLLAQAYLESGQPDSAAEILEKALALYDDQRMKLPVWSVKAHYYLGLAYEQIGRNTEAIDQYMEFLETWKDADPGIPEMEDATERLRKLRT